MKSIPWQLWALAGLLIIVAGVVVAYIYSIEAGSFGGGGAIPLEVARRSMARAKRLREEADELDAALPEVDDGPSSAERFDRGELRDS